MGRHATYAPSAGDRWVACLRAVPLEAKAPPEVTSEAAQLGTDAHQVASDYLKGDITAAKRGADKLREDSEDHLDAAIQYTEHIKTMHGKIGGDLHIEQKVTIYGDHCWGTADAIIITPDLLFVSDFKSGSGYVVPVETWQLRAYAVGAVKFCQANNLAIPPRIHLEIYQPRARDIEPVRFVEYNLSDLVEFEMTIQEAIEGSLAGKGGFEVGGHCRWCRAKADCPGMAAAAVDLAHLRLHNGDPEAALDPQALGPAQLDEALKLALVVEPWIKALWARAERFLELGGTLEQAKLVAKKRQRKWLQDDEDLLVKSLQSTFGVDPYQTPKIKSPAMVERELPKDDRKSLEEFYSNESPGLTITTADDKREAAVNPEQLKVAGDLLAAQMK